jgi:hypothetical protein
MVVGNSNKPYILIDYDDTLLPTTFLEENGITTHSKLEKDSLTYQQLHELDTQVVKFLNLCYKFGNPIILTNAEKGWVLHSSKAFIPHTYKILSKMEIHSARERFSKQYKHARDWKKMLLLNDLKSTLLKSNFVISIGDSEYERSAVVHFCSKHEGIEHKNILIDADVTRLESTTLFIKILNEILKYIVEFNTSIDYVIGLKSSKHKIRSPRRSQKGMNKSPSVKKSKNNLIEK